MVTSWPEKTPGADEACTAAMPTSRQAAVSRFCLCGALFSHSSRARRALSCGELQTRFSPTRQAPSGGFGYLVSTRFQNGAPLKESCPTKPASAIEGDCSGAAAASAGLRRNGARFAPRRRSLILVSNRASSRGSTVTCSVPAAALFQPAVSPALAAVVPRNAATSAATAATTGDRRFSVVGIGSLATSASPWCNFDTALRAPP